MRKHFYVHSSNLEYIRELLEDSVFESLNNYDVVSYANCHKNEFGRIKTENSYIHLLLGSIPQYNCPWCDSPPKLTKILSSNQITSFSVYHMQCNNCGARGPALNVNPSMEDNKETMDEIESLMRARFSQRTPWDKDLIKKLV